MVAGFVKQSSGTMKIQSTPGKGTAIEILLPLASGASAPVAARAPGVLPASNGTRRILVVDDEPALAELVRAWAKEAGHTAVIASSAYDALTLLAVSTFDAMITDIMMPGQMDGIGLAKDATVSHPAMKILLMSAYSREAATHRKGIPWPLLVKPFRKEEFVMALAEAFGKPGFAARNAA
jgi:DNA-binding NtrC family response regulator